MTGNIGPGPEMMQVRTLFFFTPDSNIRKGLHILVTCPYFDPTILAAILFSSGLLVLEDTVDEDAAINKALM